MNQTLKQIEINVMRISANGKYIEFIITAPLDFQFTVFNIILYPEKDTIDLITYSVADSVFFDEDGEYITSTENVFSGLIPLSSLEEDYNGIYKIHLEALNNCQDCDDDEEETIVSDAYISNINNVYSCLIDDILAFDLDCGDKAIQDRVIRNYLLLYAHQEAMHLGYLDEAQDWLTKLHNCFSNGCGETNRYHNKGCGCSPAPVVHNCGCKR